MPQLDKRCLTFLMLLVIGSCYYSCETEKKSITVYLKPNQKLLNFPIDSTVPSIAGNCNYFKKKDKEFVLFRNHIKNSLLIFDIKKNALHKEIIFNKQGPNSIPSPAAIQMLDIDSIFVLSAYVKKMYLMDFHGEIKKVFDLAKSLDIKNKWTSEPCYNFQLNNTVCLFETTPLASPFEPLTFYKTTIGATYNWRKEELTVNYLNYPTVYQGGDGWGFYHNFYSIGLTNTNNFVVSFPLDDNIYKYPITGGKPKQYLAKSDYFSGVVSPYKQPKEFKTYYLEENAYGNIYYDPYREVYYRFAYQKIDTKNNNVMPIDPATFKKASVIILDKNFNKIGETQLPLNKHYYFNSFVGEAGLYISNSHPDNPDRDENQLSFTCYQLVDNLP